MVSSDDIPMDRGLPQGAPESPLIFTMIMDMVIRALEPQWREKGYGFYIDKFRLTAVCYADDIVLAASSKEHLEAMISDVINALGKIGLGVAAEKTHWTSTPQMPEQTLRVEAEEVAWEDSLTFVGTVVDLSGNAGPAILYRMAQANKAFAKWKEVLTCSWIPKAQRIKLLPKSVWSSLLWRPVVEVHASNWPPPHCQMWHQCGSKGPATSSALGGACGALGSGRSDSVSPSLQRPAMVEVASGRTQDDW
jgi:hypothetical protein